MAEKLFMVFNDTDGGIPVTFEPVPEDQADEIIKIFPDRYKQQGYYSTNRWERIRPEDVVLRKVEFIDDEDDHEYQDEDDTIQHLSPDDQLLQAAKNALADMEGIMPEFEPSGDRQHPAWKTIEELRKSIERFENRYEPF